MSYSNSDLAELRGRFPNIVRRSSLDEPGARPLQSYYLPSRTTRAARRARLT